MNLAFNRTCSATDCGDDGLIFDGGKCLLHAALAKARELSPDQFDRLRAELQTTAPITDAERRQRRGRHALREIEWKARDLKRAKRDARKAGVTEGQIRDAANRGKAAVQ